MIEGLEHGLHGVHRPHQPDQLGCNVVDGPSHGPAQGRGGGGTARAPAMVGNSWARRVGLRAGTGAAAVSRGDGFVMNWIPQDHDESRAKVFPGKEMGRKMSFTTSLRIKCEYNLECKHQMPHKRLYSWVLPYSYFG